MSRTGASTPEVMKTAAAASSRACSFRRASARFPRVRAAGPLLSGTVPLPLVDALQNGALLRIVNGAMFRFLWCHNGRTRRSHVTHDRSPVRDRATAPQQVTYQDVLRVWREADSIPQIEHAWVFDHLLPIAGDLDGPIFEGWTLLSALAAQTDRLRLGTIGFEFRVM